MKNNLIYLDNQATTPIDPKVLEMMNPYLTKYFGNPASINHIFGWQAEEAITIARERVAKIINANTNEIIFTSGATESINLALKGLVNKKIPMFQKLITCDAQTSGGLLISVSQENTNRLIEELKKQGC